MRRHPVSPPTAGFGLVTVLIVLVALAAIAAAVVRTTRQAHETATKDMTALRAQSAAQSGIQWGLYQAFKGSWAGCAGNTQTLDFWSELGVKVKVTCSGQSFIEGVQDDGSPRTVRIYTIDAVACNDSAGCPSGAYNPQTYVERARRVQVTE